MSAETQYNDRLKSLSAMKHARNPQLPGIARLGQMAGKASNEVADDIMSYCGEPRLEEREVRRAVEYVFAQPVTSAYTRPVVRYAPHKDFVADAVNSCTAGSAELIALSPQAVNMMTPREQALSFIETVFPDNRYFVFHTVDCYAVRDERTVSTPLDLYREIGNGGTIPNFVIANMFTGIPSDIENAQGGPLDFPVDTSRCKKFANKKTLATFRLCLVEFDDMPIKDQCAFWSDMIRSGKCKPRTIVYSGGKSLHALVRIDAKEFFPSTMIPGSDAYEAARSECEEYFADKQREIESLLGCSDDKRFRMDRACKDPTRLTRMAGAYRRDKGKVQKLLYCQYPNDFDVPKAFEEELTKWPGYGLNGEYMDF